MRRNLFILTATLIATFGLAMQAQAHPDYGCSGCHVPHTGWGDNSEVPLWNPSHKSTLLTTHYQGSSTLNATLAAPDGSAKLCLSCHDGSYDHVSAAHSFSGAVEGKGGLGSLTNTHPISFVYDKALADADKHLVDPSTLDKDILDANGKVQCVSCHQVHAHPDRQVESNLRWSYAEGKPTAAFCRHCHVK